jgi:hypothetical protein
MVFTGDLARGIPPLRTNIGVRTRKPGGRFSIERFYSDYHDVGGVKLPFKVVQRTETSETTTTLREVEINKLTMPYLSDRQLSGNRKNQAQ